MKAFWIILAIIVVVLIVWLVVSGDDNTNTTNNTNTVTNTTANTNRAVNINTAVNSNTAATVNTNATTNTNAAAVNTNTAASEDKSVSVTSGGFSPQTVTISVGGKVTWTNNDTKTHYVAPNDHPTHQRYAGVWDDDGTGSMSAGRTYSKTFTIPGTYSYHDHLYSNQTGTVIVQ